MILLAFAGCTADAAVSPSNESTGETTSFGTEAVELAAVPAHGQDISRRLCLLVADTPELRRVGLSGREDLGGFDGMLFVFEDTSDHRFWMRDTHIPLDLVPVDAAGQVIDVIPMEPCPGGDCPTYSPDAPYGLALELPQGDLETWGFETAAPGLEVERSGETCRAATDDQ